MKKMTPRLRPLLWAAAFLLILPVSLWLTTRLQNGSRYATGIYDDYSQQLIYGRMHQMQQGQSTPGGFLGAYQGKNDAASRYLYLDNEPIAPERYQVYAHQTGLQGWTFGHLSLLLRGKAGEGELVERQLYDLNCLLFYAVTLTIGLAVAACAGPLPGLAWVAAAIFAPWVQRGMKDLYWCLWLWWLPCLAGLLLCAVTLRRKRTPVWCFLLVGLSCMVRCMCGFEFISTFLILMEIPLVYCFLQQNANRKRWFRRMVWTGVSGLGGVAAALVVWLVQSMLYFGSLSAAFRNIAVAAATRMSLTDGEIRKSATVSGVLYKYLVAEKTELLRLGNLSVTPVLLLGTSLAVLAVGALLFLLLKRWDALCWLLPWGAVWLLSLLAPISWLVLSKAHSDIHSHLVPMLWHFGFVPASCAVITAVLCRMALLVLPQKGK